MKNLILIFIWSISGILLASVEPHLSQKVKEYERDGLQIEEVFREAFFINGKFQYLTKVEKGTKKLIKKKWGDTFFGLEFGRPVRSNGSWSLWSFFEIHYLKNGRYVNAVQEFLPENIGMLKLDDRIMLNIVLTLEDKSTDGKLYLQLLQLKSNPGWIFVRAEFNSTKYSPWRITLNAYPGNSNNIKERERWLAISEGQYNLSSGATDIPLKSSGILLFSKFAHEEYGNMLVFNPESYHKLTVPKAVTNVSLQFFPRKNTKEYIFGLSYFSELSVADMIPRFLNEDVDHIIGLMKNIDWTPSLKTDEFQKEVEALTGLLKKIKELGHDTTVSEKQLVEIQNIYRKAAEENDYAEASAAFELLEKIKKQTASEGLGIFR